MSAADVPLRIEFEKFKRRQQAIIASLSGVVSILAGSQIAVVSYYTDLAAGNYTQYMAILLLSDVDDDPAMLTRGDTGLAVDNRNQFEDGAGNKFKRINVE